MKPIDYDSPFRAEDFGPEGGYGKCETDEERLIAVYMKTISIKMAGAANARFQELLAQCPTVQGKWFAGTFSQPIHATHEAKLWGVKEIEKE